MGGWEIAIELPRTGYPMLLPSTPSATTAAAVAASAAGAGAGAGAGAADAGAAAGAAAGASGAAVHHRRADAAAFITAYACPMYTCSSTAAATPEQFKNQVPGNPLLESPPFNLVPHIFLSGPPNSILSRYSSILVSSSRKMFAHSTIQ